MKRQIFLILLLSLALTEVLMASHIVGGSITYRWLAREGGSNRYRFTMRVYRDRFPVGPNAANSFDNPTYVGIFRGNTLVDNQGRNAVVSTVLNYVETEVTNPSFPCLTPPGNIGVNEAFFTWEAVLPVVNETYSIVYQRCCRNRSISNIMTPGTVGASFYITISPEAQRLNNSSPEFNSFPPTLVCLNEPLNFDHGATDVDGDDITYEFCNAVIGGNPNGGQVQPNPPSPPPFQSVIYQTPDYTAAVPMGGNPRVVINARTGLITGTPTVEAQFVVAVCVREYRNGVLLSTLQRDFQFNIVQCRPTVAANIESDSSIRINGEKRFFIRNCGARNITLGNVSTERNNIFEFYYLFDIAGTSTRFNDWSPNITFPDTGVYNGKLFLNPGTRCADTAHINITIAPLPKPDFIYRYDTCIAGPVTFVDRSSANGRGNIVRWFWSLDNGRPDTLVQSPIVQYATPGRKRVRLEITNDRQCTSDTTQEVTWYPVPPLIVIEPSTFRGCTPADITFKNLSTPIDSTYRVIWNFGDGSPTVNRISPNHIYNQAGIYSVSVDITSPIGCRISRSYPNWIEVKVGATADFNFSPQALTTANNTATFQDLSLNATAWRWFFIEKSRQSISLLQNPTHTFRDTGLVRVRQVAINQRTGCADTLEKVIDIEPIVTFFMPNAFTPNEDSNNEIFKGRGQLEGMKEFKMRIWSRWGELLFETDNPSEGWNGRKFNTGGAVPQGVYPFIVNYLTSRGIKEEIRGYATLLR